MQRWLTRRVAIIAAASLVGVLLLAVGGLYLVQRDRVLPNTTVAGIDVGRMTADEARAALRPLATSREGDPVELTFEDETFVLVPNEVGYGVDLDGTVAAAMARGRSGLPGELRTRIASLRSGNHIELYERLDDDILSAWIDGIADEVDRDVFTGRVTPDPDTLEVDVEYPHSSAAVRRDETVQLVAETLLGDDTREHELPVDTEPSRISDDAIDQVAAQVAGALEGEVTLESGDDALVFPPSQLARVIEVVERDDGDTATLELVVDADEVAEVVGDVGDRFDSEPVNARFVTSRTPPASFDDQGSTSFSPVEADVQVEPGQEGARFDVGLVAEQLEGMLREGATAAELELATVEPELSTERAEELAPTHLIGTFTTYHPAGQARVVNIQLLADIVDDRLVLPGEQFSINETSGRRTCERGFRPAGTIVRGELTDTCGGGTSQFGTTTFNAAFFAGVQLDQWKAHSWYFTRYPMGREATLNYPELDVRFTNTTDGAIIVRTSYTPGSITVSLYGQPTADAVSATHSGAFGHRDFSEERRETDDRCEGETSVLQDGAGGFSVDVTREIARVDGSTDAQNIRTVYVPRTRIVEVGTQDCGGDDEDDEDDEDDDEDDEDEGDEDDD